MTLHPAAYMVQQADANGIQPVLATIPHAAMERPTLNLPESADSSQAQYARIDSFINSWIKEYEPTRDWWWLAISGGVLSTGQGVKSARVGVKAPAAGLPASGALWQVTMPWRVMAIT